MISAIRSIVNHQNIRISIDEVKENVEITQEHTDYINNFLAPYLKSDYAPYFFAHENNQIFVGEKIINILAIDGNTELLNTLSTWVIDSITNDTNNNNNDTLPHTQWNTYLSDILSSIRWWHESFL